MPVEHSSIAFLYELESLREKFGKHFCSTLIDAPHGEQTLIARFPRTTDDGHDVRVYATVTPAIFYTIVAEETFNDLGQPRKGFTINTGSGMTDWVIETSTQIAGGMIGFSN